MADSTKTFTLKFEVDSSGAVTATSKVTAVFQEQEQIITKLNSISKVSNELEQRKNGLIVARTEAYKTLQSSLEKVNSSSIGDVAKYREIISLTLQYNEYLVKVKQELEAINAAQNATTVFRSDADGIRETPRNTPLQVPDDYDTTRQKAYLEMLDSVTRSEEEINKKRIALLRNDIIQRNALEQEAITNLTAIRNKELTLINNNIQKAITARKFGANSIQALELKAAQEIISIKEDEAAKLKAIEDKIQADRLAGRSVNIGATNAQISGIRNNTETAIDNANAPVVNRQAEIAAFNNFLNTEQTMLQESINKQIAIRQYGLNSIEVAEQEHIARRRQAEETLQSTLRTLQSQIANGTINPADAQRATNAAQQEYISTVMRSVNALHTLREAQQQNVTTFRTGLTEQNAAMRAGIEQQIATARYGAQSIQVERIRANEAIRQAEVRLANEIASIQARVNTTTANPNHLTATAGLQQATAAQQRYTQEVLRANRALNEQEAAANSATRANTNLFLRIGELVGMYRVWMFAQNTLTNALKAIPRIGIELEATFSTLLSTMGSTAGAVGAMKMLDAEAERTGITISTLRTSWRDFSASTAMAGATTESTVKMFTNLNTVITALHLSTDRAQGVFNAMAQIFNKGKVQSEELVKQLGNLLPGAFASFAASMNNGVGISTEELAKRMKLGLIKAKDTMEDFTNYMANAFSKSFAQASIGMNASVGRMQTAFTHLGETFYNLSSGVLVDIVNKITDATNSFSGLIKETQTYNSKLTILKDALEVIFVVGIASWIKNMGLLTGALTLMIKNPVVVSLIAIGTALKYMYDRSTEASDALKQIHDDLETTDKAARDLAGSNIAIKVEDVPELVAIKDKLVLLGKAYEDVQNKLDKALVIHRENPNAATGSAENILKLSEQIRQADEDRIRLIQDYNGVYAAKVAEVEAAEIEAKKRQNKNVAEEDAVSAKQLKEGLDIKEQLLKQYIKGLEDDKEQELNVIKLADAALERQLKLNLVSLDEYYRKKEQLTQRGTDAQLKAIDAEIEALRQAQGNLPKAQAIDASTSTSTNTTHTINYEVKADTGKARAEIERYNGYIEESSKRWDINPIIIKAVMEVESKGDPNVVSPKGAMGLMQLMEGALIDTKTKLADAFKPDINIDAGVEYLSQQAKRFQGDSQQLLKSLAAYNNGIGNVQNTIAKAKSMGKDWLNLLPKETANYIPAVMNNIARMTGQSVSAIKQVATATNQLEASSTKRMEYEAQITELQKERINVTNEQMAAEQESDDSKLARVQAISDKQLTDAEVYQKKVEEIIALMNTPLNDDSGFAMSAEEGTKAIQAAAENFDKEFGAKLNEPVNNALPALEKYNETITKIMESTTNLGDVNSAMYNSALKGIHIATGALENFIKTNANYAVQIKQMHEERNKAEQQVMFSKADDMEEKQIKLAKIKLDYKEAEAKLDYESLQNNLTGIRQLTGAAANMFNQKSKAAKALHAIEQGIAVAQMAMQTAQMVKTVANTGAKVAEGSATLVAESGWAGFAGIAVFLALMAGLGFGGGGGGKVSVPSKPEPNVNMGTGTVLGDPEAVSESVQNVVDILDKIHAEEYIELRGINDGVKKLAGGIDNSIARLFKAGGLNIPNIDFKKGIDQVLSGIQIPTTAMSQILNDWVMNYKQFDIIRHDYGNDKYSFEGVYSELDDSVVTALHEVFQGIGESMMNAAEILGDEFVERLKNYTFPGMQIDIMGLNGEEASKKVSGAISAMLDTAADEVFIELGKYQKLGEGMFETAIRVIADLGITQNSFKMLGLTFNKTGLDAIDFTETLIGVGGDINKLRNNFVNFFNKFYSSADQQASVLNNLVAEFEYINQVLPTTRDQFKQLVKDLLQGNEKSKVEQDPATASVLLGLAAQMDTYYAVIEKAQTNLFKNLFELNITNTQTIQANITKQEELLKTYGVLSKVGFKAGDTTEDTQKAITAYLKTMNMSMEDFLDYLEKYPRKLIGINAFLELAASNLAATPELVTLADSRVKDVEKILKDFNSTLENTVKKAKDNLYNVISNPKYTNIDVNNYVDDALLAAQQDFEQAQLDLTKFYETMNKSIADRLTSINDFIETTSIGLIKDPASKLAAERTRNTTKQQEQFDILNTPVAGETLQEKSTREIGALTTIETLIKEKYATEIQYLKDVQAEQEKVIRDDYKDKEADIKKSFADIATQIKKDNEPVVDTIKEQYNNLADGIKESFGTVADGIRDKFDAIKESVDEAFTLRQEALNEANSLEVEALQEQYAAKNELINESFNNEADKIREKYQLEADKIESIKTLTESINSSIAQLRQHVKDLLTDTELSPLTNAGRLAESQKAYQEALAKASTGDVDAINNVSTYLDKYLSEARGFYASSEEYQRLFYQATSQANALNISPKSIEEQVAANTAAAAKSNEQIVANTAAMNAELKVNSDALKAALKASEGEQKGAEKVLADQLKVTLKELQNEQKLIDKANAVALDLELKANNTAMDLALKENSKALDVALQANTDALDKLIEDNNTAMDDAIAANTAAMEAAIQVTVDAMDAAIQNQLGATIIALQPIIERLQQMQADNTTALIIAQQQLAVAFTEQNNILKNYIQELLTAFRNGINNTNPLSPSGKLEIIGPDGKPFSFGSGMKFASGGVFTNSVVNKPTKFNMAEMGENGPEAILPLAMINGKLGVSSNSGNSEEIVAELRALRKEVETLRAEQHEQTGAIISSNYDATEQAAQTVVTGNEATANKTVWKANLKPTKV